MHIPVFFVRKRDIFRGRGYFSMAGFLVYELMVNFAPIMSS